MNRRQLIATCVAGLCATWLAWAGTAGALESASDVVDATGVKGGLVVHVGCGDGKLTAALRVNDSYLVHGIDADAGNVEQAREHIRQLGLYGNVSVERWTGNRLPYAENLVNLLVAEQPTVIGVEEMMRVLCPNGVAYIKKGGAWTKSVKPRPTDIDEWTHYLHGADNNAVAKDTVVAPPRHLQWIAGPLWLRSHEIPSGFQAQVVGGGRVFYILDEGPIGITDQRIPERWSIYCRDAFGGKLLWRKNLPEWGWSMWAKDRAGKDWTKLRAFRTVVPPSNQRRMVTDGDRLYVTLGFNAPVSILDAATGSPIATVQGTENTDELLLSDGILLAKRKGKTGEHELVAVRAEGGDVLWRQTVGGIRSLQLAIDDGRVFYIPGRPLEARELRTGKKLWQVNAAVQGSQNMVATKGVVLLLGRRDLASHDAKTGKALWKKKIHGRGGFEGQDLFVVDGLAWPGIMATDDRFKPSRRGDGAVAVGYDLRTGEVKRRIRAANLRSPEHHHRCYRNKATSSYLISGLEGVEFLNLTGDNHLQHNWIRGACRMGIVPCNGMLYVPPDQCFCQPAGKLLGFAALKAAGPRHASRVPRPEEERLLKGPAYGQATDGTGGQRAGDWPTYRHDAKRSGSTTSNVPTELRQSWKTDLGGRLSTLTSANGKVFVAQVDSHTVYALDAASGTKLWRFTAGGRVDSPPTIHGGLVLFGSADGHVYCLRETDGKLVWRFRAAPRDVRIGAFDQLESAWPVHGSVLIRDDLAYFTAGRSSYLDGGIRVYAVDPRTGKVVHEGLIEGPHRDLKKRDVAFFVPGANSDVLVSEGDHIFMRQKQLTPDLKEVPLKVLSSKGEANTGLHLFSTSGLLDDSWYNRAFWMYSKRWPGFQLANQSSKSGQLIVFDDERTYALRVFYVRNVHSPMFYPGKQGYLLFADKNTTEPQIVGEQGAKAPVRWLPMSDYHIGRGKAIRRLDSPAFGKDKLIGYTRNEPPVWKTWVPVRISAMVLAGAAPAGAGLSVGRANVPGGTLFFAGPPDVLDPEDPMAAFEGRKGGALWAVSAADGKRLAEHKLESPPVFDGMIAAGGRLYMSTRDGKVRCFAGR